MALKQFNIFKINNTDPEHEEDLSSSYFSIINMQAFHRKQNLSQGYRQFKFQAFLSDPLLEHLDQFIIQKFTNNLENSVRADIKNFEVYETEDPQSLKEVGLSQDILPFDMQFQKNGSGLKVVLPIINKVQFHTLIVLVFDIEESMLPMISYINNELSNFI